MYNVLDINKNVLQIGLNLMLKLHCSANICSVKKFSENTIVLSKFPSKWISLVEQVTETRSVKMRASIIGNLLAKLLNSSQKLNYPSILP